MRSIDGKGFLKNTDLLQLSIYERRSDPILFIFLLTKYIYVYTIIIYTYQEAKMTKIKKQLTMKEWLNRPKKRISVWMDQWQIEQLKTLSQYTRINASEYIREGVNSVLLKNRKNYRKAKNELKRDM
jgi:hypothetical protein